MVAPVEDDLTTPGVLVTMGAEGGERHYVGEAHLGALRAVGLLPVLVPGTVDDEALDRLADLARAVYLPGGDWVPERLGDDADPRSAAAAAGLEWDPHKVRADLALLRRAAARGLPVLGVCGGMQAMAIAAGGELRVGGPDEIARHADGGRHGVRTEAHTRAAALLGPELETSSHHRQLVAGAGALRVSAHAADGTPEAVERPGDPLWLGVQWHPERDGDPRPFRALAEAAAR
jgi:putative glutamine amidotransferase